MKTSYLSLVGGLALALSMACRPVTEHVLSQSVKSVAFFGAGADRVCYYLVAMRRMAADTTLTRRACVETVVAEHQRHLTAMDQAIGARIFSTAGWSRAVAALQDSTEVAPWCPEQEDEALRRLVRAVAQHLPGDAREALAVPGLALEEVVVLSLSRLCPALTEQQLRELADFAATNTARRYVLAATSSLAALLPELGGSSLLRRWP